MDNISCAFSNSGKINIKENCFLSDSEKISFIYSKINESDREIKFLLEERKKNEENKKNIEANANEILKIKNNLQKNNKNDYNIFNNYMIDEVNMSFVGIFVCNDGILAFGDTKGTILNKYHDKKRGEIRKTFQNENFVLITFGNNMIKDEKIEDVLSKEIKRQCDLESTMKNIHNRIIGKSNLEYNFVCYDKKSKNIVQYNIKDGYMASNTINNYFYSGHNDYVSFMNILIAHNFQYKKDKKENIELLSVQELKKKINNILTFFIKTLDNSLEYNPVGLPLLFEEYYYSSE